MIVGLWNRACGYLSHEPFDGGIPFPHQARRVIWKAIAFEPLFSPSQCGNEGSQATSSSGTRYDESGATCAWLSPANKTFKCGSVDFFWQQASMRARWPRLGIALLSHAEGRWLIPNYRKGLQSGAAMVCWDAARLCCGKWHGGADGLSHGWGGIVR